MKFACPHCTQNLEIADLWAGRVVACASCQQSVTVPSLPGVPMRKAAPPPPPKSPPLQPCPVVPGRLAPSKPPSRRRGGGFGKFLLALIILAGAGFGYAMIHFNESPQQVWQRLIDAVERLAKPAPTPMPPPSPTPDPAPEPEPEPVPMPETEPDPVPLPEPLPMPTPEPSVSLEEIPTPPPVDPLAWLLAHKEQAPNAVRLQRPATLSISEKGEVIGSVTVPTGTTVQVVGFTAETVTVRTDFASGQIPIDATNLRAWAEAKQAKATPRPSALQPASRPTSPTARRAAGIPTPRFTSPGVLFTRADLDLLKANIKREPWKSGYESLARSNPNYKMHGPRKEVSRAPHHNLHQWRRDMVAIWNLSRMWYFTGDDAYAQKAREVLLAWATTHTSFGGRESMLDLGDYAVCFVVGADILRGTWPGWTATDTAVVKKYFNDVLIPATNPYGESMFGAANKGGLALCAKGLMAIFNEDQATLDTVVYQIRTLAHIGLRNSNDIGMLGDSLRDQGHAHGQVLSLAILAEALWKQGIDIYSDYDNRILAAGEYFARVNNLTPTPFLPFGTTDSYYIADVTNRGWDGGKELPHLIHGAYVVRKGLPAPYTEVRRQGMRVDGGSFMFIKEVDRSVATPPPPPAIPATTSITSGFSSVAIGNATPDGKASYSGGTWTVQGGGNQMWGTHDSSHFTYKAVTGDCAIIAKVESVEDTHKDAKAGVMIRTSLTEGAPRAWMAVTPGIRFEQNIQGGIAAYGGSNYANRSYALGTPKASYWVKLERIGKIVTGYVSPDGTNWAATDVGRLDNPPATWYVGLMVCSVRNGTLNTSTFSNVQITGGNGGAPAVTPAAPAALLAAPGKNFVSLRWQSSFGATRYTVKRATTRGGPYVTVATDITANTYTDTSVRTGTTYFYVVSAVNSAGASPDSPEDAATPGVPITPIAATKP